MESPNTPPHNLEVASDPEPVAPGDRVSDAPDAAQPDDAPGAELPVPDDPVPAPMPLPLETLPARMLNEFVYCPRLFYYEQVEGVFVDNADTLRGSSLHRRVDGGSGAMAAPVASGATAAAPEPSTPAKRSKPKVAKGDAATGAPAGAAEQAETIHSRSVMLGSNRLGVTAKLDLVEIRTGPSNSEGEGSPVDLFSVAEVCPVDYKAGSPRENENGVELWDTDKMQLGLQVLLLRENGYACERGIIYYRGTKQRVPLMVDPELESWVVERIAEARRTAAGPIPPPLMASPKCVRCSLNSVCLPDETRLLAETARRGPGGEDAELKVALGTTSAPPRRLMAARDDKRVLHLNTPGLRIGCSDELLVVKESDKILEKVRAGDVSHVALFGNIQISTQAIQMLCELEIPVTYFSMGGWFYGITRGHELKNVFTRIEQFRLSRDPVVCLALARRFVHGKIRNHRTLLMRNHVEPPAPILAKLKWLAESALKSESIEMLLGTEGAAASFYFGQFAGMLKPDEDAGEEQGGAAPMCFDFAGRNRRPPTDPINAMLSLAYSLLSKDCTLAALAVGLDPYIGYYHQPRFGRPALALDVMEEFRPLIAESVVLTAVNNRMILPKHFVQAGRAVNLSPAGRKLFFQVYEQRMNAIITHPLFEYKVSYRRVLELQFRLLARYLTGEIPEYVPFVTR